MYDKRGLTDALRLRASQGGAGSLRKGERQAGGFILAGVTGYAAEAPDDFSAVTMMALRPKALIVAHDARATGGVNNFLRIMRIKMRPRVEAIRFANGRRHREAGKVATLLRLLKDYGRFFVLLRSRALDVIHINPTLDLSSLPRELVFVWLARLARPQVKILMFYRGWDWTALRKIEGSWLGRRIFLASQARVDRILLLSSSFKAALVRDGVPAEKIHVVTTMFEGDALAPVLQAHPIKEEQLIVFMSRFLPAKGGGTLIDAFAGLSQRYPEARLIMAGDGPDAPRLKALVVQRGLADRVTFTGYIGGTYKMSLLARATLFVLPTTHPEGMPNAILEAMAAGDVVISTAIGGIPDVVEDGSNGAIIVANDVEALGAKITYYFDHPEETAEIVARNREKAWRLWESATVANRIADHYADMIAVPAAALGS